MANDPGSQAPGALPGGFEGPGWPRVSPTWDPGRRSYAVTGPPVASSPYNLERADSATLPWVQGVDVGSNWFSPGQPVWPFGPPYINYGRTWDYPLLVNIEFEPRRQILQQFLKGLATNSSILRTVIEKRKDQVLSIPWNFVREDGKRTDADKRIKQLQDFFEFPDGEHDYDAWSRMILEDLFVLDAVTVYQHKSLNGTPLQFRIFDGGTMKVVIDDAGRVPEPPSVAYQQIIKGLPMVNFSKDEIMYCPMNPRPGLPIYGYSPVEWIYLDIVTSIRRQVYMGNFYLEGTIPDLILQVPQDWTSQQLAQYQAFFDTLLSGNFQLKSKVRFLPAGVVPHTPKGAFGELLKNEVDEWLARIICAAFKINPQSYSKLMNRATAQTHQQESQEEGLQPLMAWHSRFMNRLIRQFGWTDIYHKYLPKSEVDAKTLMDLHTGYLKVGVLTRNEIRDELGRDPLPKVGDMPVDITAGGDVPIGPQQAQGPGPGQPWGPGMPGPGTRAAMERTGEQIQEMAKHDRPAAYKVNFQGLMVNIENPVNSIRQWDTGSTQMRVAYGNIARTQGNDGDRVDCYLGPNKNSDLVWVIRQNTHDGLYDEDKCFLGFDSIQEVMDTYAMHRDDGISQAVEIAEYTIQEFKDLICQPKPQVNLTKRLPAARLNQVTNIIRRQFRTMAHQAAARAEKVAQEKVKARVA